MPCSALVEAGLPSFKDELLLCFVLSSALLVCKSGAELQGKRVDDLSIFSVTLDWPRVPRAALDLCLWPVALLLAKACKPRTSTGKGLQALTTHCNTSQVSVKTWSSLARAYKAWAWLARRGQDLRPPCNRLQLRLELSLS